MSGPRIETERTLLRPFQPDDEADLYEILGDEETMRYAEPPYDRVKTARFLKDFCIDRGSALACVQKQEQKVIGYLLFHPLEPQVYEVGWFFNRSYWGQGYAFESCRALMHYAFQSLGARRIVAETIDCVKSAGLMKKLGMRLDGVQPVQAMGRPAELYCFGISNDESDI